MATLTHRDLIFELKRAKNVLFYTGADISADEGLATFYSPGDIWEYYDVSELSSLQGFEKDPQTSWRWYQHRRRSVASKGPTKAHLLLEELNQLVNTSAIITQNVDCLHQISGTKNVMELHGNIFKSKCIKCETPFTNYTIFQDELPKCDKCGGDIRPDVKWFGEEVERLKIQKVTELAENCDVLVTIGIYQQMFPAQELIRSAKQGGAFMLEISKEKSINSSIMNRTLNGKYSKILENIIYDYKNLFVD